MYDVFYGILVFSVFFFGYLAVKKNPNHKYSIWIKSHKAISIIATLMLLGAIAPDDNYVATPNTGHESREDVYNEGIEYCSAYKTFVLSLVKSRDSGMPKDMALEINLRPVTKEATRKLVIKTIDLVYDSSDLTQEIVGKVEIDKCAEKYVRDNYKK